MPSLLTSARDRSADGFGANPIANPGDVGQLPGANTPSNAAWRTGISWNPTSCHRPRSWPLCQDDVDAEKELGESLGLVDVSPFFIYQALVCDLTTLASEQRLDDDAQALLDAGTADQVAETLWMGTGYLGTDTTPTLRNAAQNVTPGGAAVPIEDAFAILLAEYTACTGKGGAVFHVPTVMIPEVLGASDGGKLAERVGDVYRGPMDSIVSPGPGYPMGASAQGAGGYGPEVSAGTYRGNDGDDVWVYVTGMVEYALGPVAPAGPQATDRRAPLQNQYEVLVERPAIVRFDPCCTFAVLTQSVPVVVT